MLETDSGRVSTFAFFSKEFFTAMFIAEVATASVVFATVDGVAHKSRHPVTPLDIAGLLHNLLGDLNATHSVYLGIL